MKLFSKIWTKHALCFLILIPFLFLNGALTFMILFIFTGSFQIDVLVRGHIGFIWNSLRGMPLHLSLKLIAHIIKSEFDYCFSMRKIGISNILLAAHCQCPLIFHFAPLYASHIREIYQCYVVFTLLDESSYLGMDIPKQENANIDLFIWRPWSLNMNMTWKYCVQSK